MGTATQSTKPRKQRTPRENAGMKTCPDCAEEVRSAARKCKHCDFRFEPLVEVRPEAAAGTGPEAAADAAPEAPTRQHRRVVRRGAAAQRTLELPTTTSAAVEAPPAATDKPAPDKPAAGRAARLIPTRRRNQALLTGVVLLVVAAIAATALLWGRGDRQRFEAALNDSREQLRSLNVAMQELEAGDPHAEARQLRGTLRSATAELSDRRDDVSAIDNEELALALRSELAAEGKLYAEATRLMTLPVGNAVGPELAELPNLAAAVTERQDRVTALSERETLRPVAVEVQPVTRVLVHEQRRFSQAAVAARRARDRARAKNQQLAVRKRAILTYSGSMNGVLSRYSQSREDLQTWVSGVRSGSYTSFAEAYQVLAQQSSRRAQLRSEMAALTPPAEMAGGHAAMLRVVDRAIDATDTASRGIAEYQSDMWGEYMYFEETPGWRAFQTESDSITEAYDAAWAQWTGERTAALRVVKQKAALVKLPENAPL